MTGKGAGDPSTTLDTLRSLGLVAVVRSDSPQSAVAVSEALIEGGVRCIEIAFTTPGAAAAIAELARTHGGGILLGAGTVTEMRQAEAAADAGATFLVSPGCEPRLVAAMLDVGLLVMPGVLTPSDVMIARGLGAEALKLFPASVGGPAYLKALLAPFPTTQFLPTGGVTPENAAEWFAAGAIAVGAGGSLAPGTLEAGNRADVVDAARRFAAAVAKGRAEVAP